MTNSATHTRPELAKTDGYAVKTKQRCLLCSGIYRGGMGVKSFWSLVYYKTWW